MLVWPSLIPSSSAATMNVDYWMKSAIIQDNVLYINGDIDIKDDLKLEMKRDYNIGITANLIKLFYYEGGKLIQTTVPYKQSINGFEVNIIKEIAAGEIPATLWVYNTQWQLIESFKIKAIDGNTFGKMTEPPGARSTSTTDDTTHESATTDPIVKQNDCKTLNSLCKNDNECCSKNCHKEYGRTEGICQWTENRPYNLDDWLLSTKSTSADGIGLGLTFAFKNSETILKDIAPLGTNPNINQTAIRFKNIFMGLFDGMKENLNVMFTNALGVDYSLRALQIENAALKEQINILKQGLTQIAPVAMDNMSLEWKLKTIQENADIDKLINEVMADDTTYQMLLQSDMKNEANSFSENVIEPKMATGPYRAIRNAYILPCPQPCVPQERYQAIRNAYINANYNF